MLIAFMIQFQQKGKLHSQQESERIIRCQEVPVYQTSGGQTTQIG